jgi:PPM family protein phosphatase
MTSPEYANRLRANIFSWLSRKTSDYGTQNIPEISAAIGTDLGQSRKANQDYGAVARYSGHSVADSWTAFALCDGIGGLRDGGVCARTAMAALFTSLLQSRIPDRAVHRA